MAHYKVCLICESLLWSFILDRKRTRYCVVSLQHSHCFTFLSIWIPYHYTWQLHSFILWLSSGNMPWYTCGSQRTICESQLSPLIMCGQDTTRVSRLGCRLFSSLNNLKPAIPTLAAILYIIVCFISTFLVWHLKRGAETPIKMSFLLRSGYLSLLFTSLWLTQDNRLSSQMTCGKIT